MKLYKQIAIGVVSGVITAGVLSYMKKNDVPLGDIKKMQKEVM